MGAILFKPTPHTCSLPCRQASSVAIGTGAYGIRNPSREANKQVEL